MRSVHGLQPWPLRHPSSPRHSTRVSAGARVGSCVATAALALIAFGAWSRPAHAGWSHAAPGSWVVVEQRDHALSDRPPQRLTTTLVRRTGGVDWFEHRDDAGAHWTDTDGRGESDPALPVRAGVRERVLGTESLRLDGRAVRCRVVLIEATSRPFVSQHPVREWVVRTRRWIATDSGLVDRVLRWSDAGTETRFRDGRIERAPGRWTMHVKSLHERVRVRGRSYDCWVAVRKEHTESGEFLRRTTVWRYEGTPSGWVRRFTESRDPRTGAMRRSDQRIVDFRYE